MSEHTYRVFQPDHECIQSALAIEGGHLGIGRGGYTLYFARGSTLSGYDIDAMKAACNAAGLPILDSRMVDFNTVLDLAVKGPMVAVDEPVSPKPWGSLSYVPLAEVVRAYRAAGAEVLNFPQDKPEQLDVALHTEQMELDHVTAHH